MKKNIFFYDISGLLLSLFCLISMYIFPDTVKRCAFEAVVLCGRAVIPSLFPYIVLTRILLHFFSGIIRGYKPSAENGKMSAIGYAAFFLGLVSGFPTGAIVAGQMYSKGIIRKNEAERAAVFSSAASPAFCINFFGSQIMKSRLTGLSVYIAVVCVNIILFLLSGHLYNRNEDTDMLSFKKAADEKESVPQIIYDSCMTVINICAYVTFFMCAGEVVYTAVSFAVPGTELMKVLLCGTAEMTSGIACLEGMDYSARFLYGAAVIGFGGLSAIMQISSVCGKYGLSCARLFAVKAASAILVPFAAFIGIFIFGTVRDNFTGYGLLFAAASVLLSAALFAFFIYSYKKRAKKYKKSKVNL